MSCGTLQYHVNDGEAELPNDTDKSGWDCIIPTAGLVLSGILSVKLRLDIRLVEKVSAPLAHDEVDCASTCSGCSS
ncbi:hypothetical protein Pcinc_011718 [Petrolisthes cinctipes]|uniref:Uncharacterized protein n=1 Tax=Petrolisthes cinctipes TaxID=88211 RepID=A0AAE1G254_PETCI|nr:hypothetical protein Pcinc_011718 [Petrolisthes cinctipes]